MSEQKPSSPDETDVLRRERHIAALRQICDRRRDRLSFLQEMSLDDPATQNFIETIECLIEINESMVRRLEAKSKTKQ